VDRIVLDQISTVLEKAGYTRNTPVKTSLESRINSKFQLKLSVPKQELTLKSTNHKNVFERSDGLWLVCDKSKTEHGRFMSEEWALRWVDLLINQSSAK